MMDQSTILKGTSYCSTSNPTSPQKAQLMMMINFTSRSSSSIVDPTTPIITKDSEDYANPKSYLKSRRSAAKEKKRAAILDFVDSSVGNLDFSFPDFSELSPRPETSTTTGRGRPSLRSPQRRHHHKSLPCHAQSLSTTTTSSCSSPRVADDDYDDFDSSTDSVLRSLTSSTEETSTCCPFQLSVDSSHLNLSCSSRVDLEMEEHEEEEVYETEGESEEEVVEDLMYAFDNDSFYEVEVDSDGESYMEETIIMEEEEASYSEETIGFDEYEDDSHSSSSTLWIEEECMSAIEEETIEEETIEDDGYDEDESDSSSRVWMEEEYTSDIEEAIEASFLENMEEMFEEILEEGNEMLAEFEVHNTLEGDQMLERSLGSINEADYDFEEESQDSDYEVEDEEISVDDDFSIIEEEIIFKYEVPVVPAIAAWQAKEEARIREAEVKPLEVATRTPREILMAVLAASAMDFKLRKVPQEHKRRFVPVADAVASLGRLNRLNEVVVEAMGHAAASKKSDEEWQPTSAPIVVTRSLNLRIATEAAAMGRVMRLPERVVTNYEELSTVDRFFLQGESKVNVDDMVDEMGHRIIRTSMLLPLHEQDTRQASKARDWSAGILESLWSTDQEVTLANVQLPSSRVPRFEKPQVASSFSRQKIQEAIAQGVAEGAWDRRYRLDRPQKQLRITSMCRCRYCQNPNPFQTHAYKTLARCNE